MIATYIAQLTPPHSVTALFVTALFRMQRARFQRTETVGDWHEREIKFTLPRVPLRAAFPAADAKVTLRSRPRKKLIFLAGQTERSPRPEHGAITSFCGSTMITLPPERLTSLRVRDLTYCRKMVFSAASHRLGVPAQGEQG